MVKNMIELIHTRDELKKLKAQYLESHPLATVGLVPTMGNLHEGHISLLEKSLQENDLTILTIFVNPKQFGPNEDFQKYPRTLDDDVAKITKLFFEFSNKHENVSRSVLIFAPQSEEEIYTPGFSSLISVGNITQILCGKFRPTHFDGVTTVVYKLFKIAEPNNAYFGQKDYQQCIVIQKMVNDLELGIKLHFFPIIRNANGLALSSRNQYLSGQDQEEALKLHRSLIILKNIFLQESSLEVAMEKATRLQNDFLQDTRYDYLEILDGNTLLKVNPQSTKIAILGVLRLNGTRLLDNEVIDLHVR